MIILTPINPLLVVLTCWQFYSYISCLDSIIVYTCLWDGNFVGWKTLGGGLYLPSIPRCGIVQESFNQIYFYFKTAFFTDNL